MSVTDLNRVEKAISKTLQDKMCHCVPQALGWVSLVFAAMPEVDLIVSRLS